MNTDKNKTEKLKEQLNKLLKTCNECRGNFNDDCRDCPTLNKRCSIYSELEKLKDKNMPVIVGEDTYFSAEDARRVSDEQRCSIDNVELDKVYKHINEARYKGNNKVTIHDFNLRNSTKKFLEDKGFKVDHWTGSQWDPCNDTTISW